MISSSSGERLAIDDEGVVAGRHERLWQTGEHSGVSVANQGCLAMHHVSGPNDLTAVDLAHALQPEADAEHGTAAGEVQNQVVAQAGVIRGSGTGRDEHAVRVELDEAIQAIVRRCECTIGSAPSSPRYCTRL